MRLAAALLAAGLMIGCANVQADKPFFVRPLEGDEMVPDGTVSCHTPSDPKYKGTSIVECTGDLWKQHYIRCDDKSRVLLTAEDGSHWCMAVKN